MKYIKYFFDLFSFFAIVCLVVVGILSFSSSGQLSSGYRSFLVQSGSMTTYLKIGDIIVTQPQKEYFKGDPITFYNPDNRIVTHRILEIREINKQASFLTKGDANHDSDGDETIKEKVIGKVIAVIPKLGFLVVFVKSPLGFALLIAIPIFGLIVDQIVRFRNNASS